MACPDYLEAHSNLANLLTDRGQIEDAIRHYREVLRLEPAHWKAANDLAWILATHKNEKYRDGTEAVRLAQSAQQAGGPDPGILDTLAASYAEAGRFDEAIRTAQSAFELAKATGEQQLAKSIQDRLGLYQAGRPVREY